jgi:hypothetical protein
VGALRSTRTGGEEVRLLNNMIFFAALSFKDFKTIRDRDVSSDHIALPPPS